MTNSGFTRYMKKLSQTILVGAFISLSFSVNAMVADKVTTLKDKNGWKIQVSGKDHYVKGVVWGYTPRGENYNYNLWGQSDEFIRGVLDQDFTLLKAANVNTIRAFSNIPPKWVTYVYKKYGIMTAINPLMGRYGTNINGAWVPQTNYSDPETRAHLIAEVVESVKTYKDVPGVIMIALGNESNYGLEWSASFEIENLPDGEKHKEKAKWLYSLYYDVIKAGKEIDPDRLFSIVNGDLQYMELIKKYVTNLDVLGSNVYRGIGFTDLWKRVDAELDLPVLFFEFGADAFNSKDFAEDMGAQAAFLKGQWTEMYNKSYGNGEEGNSVGGFVFQWRDEWWKYKQVEFLDEHNTHASWANGGYTYDYVEGQNNMNEEWWGITRLGPKNANGIYTAEPRTAYYVLGEIWGMDPYKEKTTVYNKSISEINMDLYEAKAAITMLTSASEQNKKFEMTGASIGVEFVANAMSGDVQENGEDSVENSNGQMIFLDFEFNPSKDISGQFSINVLGNVPNRTMEFQYGDRGATFTTITTDEIIDEATVNERNVTDNERIEIYDYNGTYTSDTYDLTTFYHVPRFHWGYEGDYFGLLRETTDMAGQDIWNSKAPFGAEFVGKQSLDGMKLLIGPEVYWGANPKAMLKYEFGGKIGSGPKYAFIHSEDVARKDSSSSPGEAVAIQTRQTTLYSKFGNSKNSLEIGAIMASTEKIGDEYSYIENGNIVTNEIDFEDTLGIKATLAFEAFGSSRAYVGLNYGGLVADGGATQAGFGFTNGIINMSDLPYSELGNKKEIEAGIQMNFGSVTILPRFMYRDNIIDANPTIDPVQSGTTLSEGLSPRNRDDNAFAVLGNRAARSGEIFFTYDPTPATQFYEWDNDRREDAAFAFNIGANYTEYPTATDANQFFYRPAGINASFGEGLPAEDVWKVKSRMVMNANDGTNIILNLENGFQQSSGTAEGPAREYYKAGAKFWFTNNHIVEGYVYKDAWGPYDFYRQFNQTYPWQYKLDYSVLMGKYNWTNTPGSTSKWGVRALYRTLDENSPEYSQGSPGSADFEEGRNSYMFEIITYINFSF